MTLRSLLILALIASAACKGSEAGNVDGEANTTEGSVAVAATPESSAVTDPETGLTIPQPVAVDKTPGAPASEATGTPASPEAPAAAPTPAPSDATQATAASILRRAEVAYDAIRTLDADFVQDLSVPILGSSQRSRGKMYVSRPDRFLMRFTDPAGDIIVADGRYLWLYYPSSDPRQVIRSPIGAGGQTVDLQKEFLSDPTTRFNAVLNGQESVGGRPAHRLTLTPKAASGYRSVRIWVDTQDALVRRFEITESNESVRRLELSNLRPNATVPASLFNFTPPAGAQIFNP